MAWTLTNSSPHLSLLEGHQTHVENVISMLVRYTYNPEKKFELKFPNTTCFPDRSSDPKENLLLLVAQIADDLEFKLPYRVIVFESATQQWTAWKNSDDKKAFALEIQDNLLQHKASLIAHIVLQLCSEKLQTYFAVSDEQWNYAEYIAAMYGYTLVLLSAEAELPPGIFVAEILVRPEIHLYALALLCRQHGIQLAAIGRYLSDAAFRFVEKYYKELTNHDRFNAYETACWKSKKMAPYQQLILNEPPYSLRCMDAYTALLELEKNDVYFNARGYGLLLNKRYSEAIDDFESCIDLNPRFAYAFNNRAYCLMMLGDNEPAWDDLESTLMLDDENSFAYRNRGIFFLLQGQPEEALPELNQALQMNPDTEHIHFWLGKVYFAMSNMNEAANQFTLSRNKPELPVPDYPV